MGGYGSGRSSGSTKWTTCDMRKLDVRSLKRDGLLNPGCSFRLSWTRNGEPTGSIGVTSMNDRVILSYRQQRPGEPWESKRYEVALERTKCNYGGERVWFRCPALNCGPRVAILYGGSFYACRKCHELTYQSQREAMHERCLTKAQAIRARLGGSRDMSQEFPQRPKGMHRVTYESLTYQFEFAYRFSLLSFFRRFP
jgi:hypothetical protein